MREMSYRDKMICLIILIIIILALGIFLGIKPTYDNIVADQATYETTKTEWDGIQQKLDAIPGLQEQISSTAKEAKDIGKIFVNEVFKDINDNYSVDEANYTVDQYIQTAINDSQLEVSSLNLGGISTEQISYYYYTPNVVTYSLLEAADINGNYAADVAELMNVQTVLSERQTADIQAANVDLNVTGTKEGIMKFLAAIKDDPNAVLVKAVSISDYKFEGGLEVDEEGTPVAPETPATPETPAEGEEPPAEGEQPATEAPAPPETPAEGGTEIPAGYSTMTINVTFYNAKAIDDPDLGDTE